MAQIEQSGGGKGKSHQKKMEIRVDFTPMVDKIGRASCRERV